VAPDGQATKDAKDSLVYPVSGVLPVQVVLEEQLECLVRTVRRVAAGSPVNVELSAQRETLEHPDRLAGMVSLVLRAQREIPALLDLLDRKAKSEGRDCEELLDLLVCICFLSVVLTTLLCLCCVFVCKWEVARAIASSVCEYIKLLAISMLLERAKVIIVVMVKVW